MHNVVSIATDFRLWKCLISQVQLSNSQICCFLTRALSFDILPDLKKDVLFNLLCVLIFFVSLFGGGGSSYFFVYYYYFFLQNLGSHPALLSLR